MHAGTNYARITVTSIYETHELEIYAYKGTKTEEKKQSLRAEIKECKAGIMELYQAYRLKKIVPGVWANETVEILNHLHAIIPDEPMYVLMKAQALVINRQRQEAEWILDAFKRDWADRHAPEWV